MEKIKKPQDPAQARQVRRNGYERNMNVMRGYKESHPCLECGNRNPHYAMAFKSPPKGTWSISRLAGSRCTIETLLAAMQTTPLFCLTCLEKKRYQGK